MFIFDKMITINLNKEVMFEQQSQQSGRRASPHRHLGQRTTEEGGANAKVQTGKLEEQRGDQCNWSREVQTLEENEVWGSQELDHEVPYRP